MNHEDFVLDASEGSQQKFCEINGFSSENFAEAKIDWTELVAVAEDHKKQIPSLIASASMYAGIVQAIDSVHSVRWRVKDPINMISKIVRKKIENKESYATINRDNYFEIITDLVGIRALHLFKEDFRVIHEALAPLLDDKESPVANIRQGDHGAFSSLCRDLGLEVKEHDAGYRSIHYVKTVKPLKHALHIEIQVRTVFEEGWSEVDHQVRYPNFSDDPFVAYASLILNRLSGMADEMSTYAKTLAKAQSEKSRDIANYQKENDAALQRIDELVVAMENVQRDESTQRATIQNLKRELKMLKVAAETDRSKSRSVLKDDGFPKNALRDYLFVSQDIKDALSFSETFSSGLKEGKQK